MSSVTPFPICKLPFSALSEVLNHMNTVEIFYLLDTSKNAKRVVSKSIRNFEFRKEDAKKRYFCISLIANRDHIEVRLSRQNTFYIGNIENIEKKLKRKSII